MPRNIQTGWSAPNVIAVDPSGAIVNGTLDVSGTPGLETLVVGGVLAGGTISPPGGTISLAIGAGLSSPGVGTIENAGVLAIAQGTVTATGTVTAGIGLTLTGTTLDASGGVSEVVAGAGITTSLTSSNGTITGTGTLSSIELPVAQTGTTYVFTASDRATLVTFSNTASIAATIAQAGTATFPNGFFADVLNLGAGQLTLTPTTSSINGTTKLMLVRGQGARIASNGTDYFAIIGSPIAAVPSSTATIPAFVSGWLDGLTRGTNAIDIQTGRTAFTYASGASAVAFGYLNTASASQGTAVGNSNTASGSSGTTAVGTNNIVGTLSNTNSTGVGASNSVSGSSLTAVGYDNGVFGTASAAVGAENTSGNALTSNSFVLGYQCSITGVGSTGVGVRATDRGNAGAFVRSGISLGGSSSALGRSQPEEYTFVNSTSGSSAVRLTTNGSAAGSTNVAGLGTSSTQMFDCWFMVTDTTDGEYCTYYMAVPSTISKGANNASTALGTTGPVFTAGDTSASPPSLAAAPTITADTTNGGYNLSYTPPVANSHLLYAVAVIRILNERHN